MQTRLTWLLAGTTALALTCAPGARAADDDQLLGGCDSAQGCAVTALEGLVSGFTSSAGGDLWGWMIGGGQSAGTSAIADALGNIQSALSTLEGELAGIQQELEQLSCSIDGNTISNTAGPIQDYYQQYSVWLQDMCNPDSNGKCQKTGVKLPDLNRVSNWASCAIGFENVSCQNDNILTLLDDLNNAASGAGGSNGAISDCIKAKAATVTPPAAGSLDDRPYYSQVVEPITSWYLTLNTQAMTVLTEAYHFQAWQAAGSPPTGSTDDLYTNVCDVSPIPEGCTDPIIIYNDNFASVPGPTSSPGFVWSQLQAGGAPYSTSDHVLLNGTVDGSTWLMVKSIETYNAAANKNCGDPSTKLCGPTVGEPGFAMESFAVGPYGFGKGTDKGTWTPAHTALFETILDKAGFNATGGVDVTLGRFLCTLSATGGNTTNCTQPSTSQTIPAASGLKNADGKGFYFPDTFEYVLTDDNDGSVILRLGFYCFMDGNLPGSIIGQPVCNQARFNHLITVEEDLSEYGCEISLTGPDGLENSQSMTGKTMGIFPDYYNAVYCLVQRGWKVRPGYAGPLPLPNPKSWQWPVLDLATITCPDGNAATNLNPAGVPTLCGDAFDVWFNTQVPPGPPQATAVADATLDRSDPNRNNGANPRLLLVGRQHRTVIGFDPEELQAFLDANPLASARLVLSSADTSISAANLWLKATPLEGAFVEGNGNAAERDRGEGSGATWNCAEDFEIADFMKECVQDWPRRFGRGRGTTAKVPDDFTGKVSFDVTKDVANGASAWVIRRLRGGHSSAFHSREGAALLDDPSLAPTLLLIPAVEDEVAAHAE